MKISEIITDKYKLRIPPTVYYELLADVQEAEEEQMTHNCLCESCCDKDYCLSYQDYKNLDGIVAEPITACGRYKKLHTVEDIYTKEEERLKADLVAMLIDIQLEIAELPAHVVSNQKSIIRMEIAPSAEDVYEIIQQKINALKAEAEGKK